MEGYRSRGSTLTNGFVGLKGVGSENRFYKASPPTCLASPAPQALSFPLFPCCGAAQGALTKTPAPCCLDPPGTRTVNQINLFTYKVPSPKHFARDTGNGLICQPRFQADPENFWEGKASDCKLQTYIFYTNTMAF